MGPGRGPLRRGPILSLAWHRPHRAPLLPRTRSPRTKPSRAWRPCPPPRSFLPASYRTSSAHPPLCPRPSSLLPHGYGGPGRWDWGEGVPLGWARWGSWILRDPGLCPVSAVLEQPPSPGTAAWTLSGVSIGTYSSSSSTLFLPL